ncbi:MAG: DNA recombination protein RmuC [Candidatus Faecimonas sp.]|nr:DNA recombination protein RmuC [Mycoplasmatota bacterium]MDY2907556.1 DNA recombination protein RmuC [Candidatus Faecimonas sp.]
MDYIIIGLLVVILVLVVISLFKNINESNITERLGRLEVNMMKEMGDFKNDLSHSLNEDFTKLNEQVERRLLAVNEKVNERLDQNFEKTNKTFMNVIERLSKIDEAQKKIETLSTDIVSLQSILTDKKTRGIFGEVNLKHILSSVFGEKNDSIYRLQYTLSTGVIADCVLFAPNPLGTIAIDSKFPLEHYQMMVDKKISPDMRDNYEKMFKQDMKKHIDAISSKYIIPGETTDQAILFLPAEAIFAEINAYHSDIIQYAYKKRVWITSPTTLISTLTVIEMIIKNMERDKYTSVIHEELNKLGLEFARYRERWDKLARSIQTVNKDVENVSITTEKISKKFDSINKVEVGLLEDKED